MTMALTGSVVGIATNPENLPVAYAIKDADTVSSILVGTSNGFFRLSFLPPGSFSASIEDTLGESAVRESVTVTAGAEHQLKEIMLQ